jgi:hypothetical protein
LLPCSLEMVASCVRELAGWLAGWMDGWLEEGACKRSVI